MPKLKNDTPTDDKKAKTMAIIDELDQLAELVGIEKAYWDIFGKSHETSETTKRKFLAAMGFQVGSKSQVRQSLADFKKHAWRQWLQPVYVLRRKRRPLAVPLTLPEKLADASFRWQIRLENGADLSGRFKAGTLEAEGTRMVDGETILKLMLPLPETVPDGYHTLTLEDARGTSERCSLIVAPPHAYLPKEMVAKQTAGTGRVWGVGCHIYALRSETDWGIGDFSDLAQLGETAAGLGAAVVGINPLHALFPDSPEHASPYSPSSRLFLNPLFIDATAVPEFHDTPEVEALVFGKKFQTDLKKVRQTRLVDYTGVATLKWQALELMHRAFEADHPAGSDADERRREFERFKAEGGQALRRFAMYETLRESQKGKPWQKWPKIMRKPDSPAVQAFVEENAARVEFHMYVQWLADTQLAAAQRRCRRAGMAVGLYRDLAVGMDPGGADAWSDPQSIVQDVRFGAPPDAFNLNGQDWGMPPLNPLGMRNSGYAPFVQIVRANMRHAGALRIDHVMGIMRLYWIPPGASAVEGAYVSYPFDDLLGIIALESHRSQCLVVGEDLGTVPNGFRERMVEERVLSYRLMYFERWPSGLFMRPDAYPENALATPTTHDLHTIVGHLQGIDLVTQRKIGLIPTDAMLKERSEGRRKDIENLLGALEDQKLIPAGLTPLKRPTEKNYKGVIDGMSRFLARSPARLVMLNIDDLFLEVEQLNIPGTVEENPNWRRKLSRPVSALKEDPTVVALTKAVAAERAGKKTELDKPVR